MILTDRERAEITFLNPDDNTLRFDEESRDQYQFEVEKVSNKEWRVCKYAIICLKVEYFSKAEDVISFIEK